MLIKNFIVLEGLDGAGTTTQVNLLDKRCREEKLPSFLTREPTDHATGLLVRQVLRKEVFALPGTIAMLFAADRYEHVYGSGGILEEAEKGKLVICDRYLFSSLAYQSVECGWQLVHSLNKDFPLPEYLVYLDIEPPDGEKRLQNREQREIFENQSFQAKASIGYKRVLEEYADSGMKIIVIDAIESPESIHEKIWNLIKNSRK